MAGRRLVFLDALRQRALPAGAGDGVGLRAGAGGALARNLEDVGPAVEHRKQVIATLRVRQAQHIRLLADIEPSGGVKRVGIGRRDSRKEASGYLRKRMNWPIGAFVPSGLRRWSSPAG